MDQDRRIEFNNILKVILGSNNVYFQPPEDRVMQYPCIVYKRDNATIRHADNVPYKKVQRYQVTLIDHNPDNDAVSKLLDLPLSAYDRHYATSGLNHDVFVIYH